jgi:hypothetical protein
MFCPYCRDVLDKPCEQCDRLRAYGTIIRAAQAMGFEHSAGLFLDVLDAVAFIMRERAKFRKQKNDELREASRQAQRDIRAAVDEVQAQIGVLFERF